jgi:hypothetical protein
VKTVNGHTALYINACYEVNLSAFTNTSYYYLSGTLIAMSVNATLKYVHKACPEHSRRNYLVGTSVVTSDNGTLIESIKYYAFCETRSLTGPDITDKLFTGQRLDDTGLYYYGARYYDPTLGR